MKNYAKVGATGLSTDSLLFLHKSSSVRMKIKTSVDLLTASARGLRFRTRFL